MDQMQGQKIIEQNILIARVVTQVSAIESIINSYIADFYTKCPEGDYKEPYLCFIFDILSGKYITVFQKVDILFKVFKRIDSTRVSNRDKNLFGDWIHIRNIFAHGTVFHEKEGMKILFNGKFYDIDSEAERHAKIQIEIHEVLDRYPELVGPYLSHTPVSPEVA